MTIIAYTKGIMAADTKAVNDENQVLKSQKLFKLRNNTVVGTAGDADARDVLELLSKATLAKLPIKLKLLNTKCNFKGLWLFPAGELFSVSISVTDALWEAEILPILDPWAAVGSGSGYALGAMVAGKTAVESVKIACKLDNNCGLPVESIKLSDIQ